MTETAIADPEVSKLKPYERRNTAKVLAVFDSETDPFELGVIPKPFTCGFKNLSTGDYVDFWGDDCIDQFFAWLLERPDAFIIYCHNFGGFDCHFMLDYLDPGREPSIINARISSAILQGQEFRDSYRIIPIPLKAYQKDTFDYMRMKRDVRESNKDDILFYQQKDCDYLGELVVRFFDLFGDRPTIGNTSITYLRSFHHFDRLRGPQDAVYRPYFFGGRNQVFEPGISFARNARFKIYDVNSMYPAAMRNVMHPVGSQTYIGQRVMSKTMFVDCEAINRGAVPTRQEDGSLDFTVKRGRFLMTVHEFHAGIATGTLEVLRIRKTINFHDWSDFAEFIDFCYEKRLAAEAAGDRLDALFWKFVMNSAYGKFAQDPARYERYVLSNGAAGIPCNDDEYDPHGPAAEGTGFTPKFIFGNRIIWSKPSPNRFNGYFNVATGASITGASRAMLLRGLSKSRRTMYCDTDSILCEEFRGDIDSKRLGAWKLEAEGDVFACGGKKLYALFTLSESEAIDPKDGPRECVEFQGRKMWCVKKASKGAVLTAAEILRIANGDVVRYKSDRPNFKLDGTVEFIERDIRRTG